MRGIFQNEIRDPNGKIIYLSPWMPNTIVQTAWLLMAGLLKNDPNMAGIAYWAVGSGDVTWDMRRPLANSGKTRLMAEFDRQAIEPDRIAYLNVNGNHAVTPTDCIEVNAVYTWPRQRVLREFGIFGGNATQAADSGYMINYVIHPRIDLAPGATLTRRMRFTFRPDINPDWLVLPRHWMGDAPVGRIDGIGRTYANLLEAAGFGTIAALAAMQQTVLVESLPMMKLVEIRAKARMILRTVANIQAVAGIGNLSAVEVLRTPPDTLAANSGASKEQIMRLQEQLGILQVGLDNRYLQEITVGQLASHA